MYLDSFAILNIMLHFKHASFIPDPTFNIYYVAYILLTGLIVCYVTLF